MTRPPGGNGPAAIVAARNEADRIGATVAALRGALPGVRVWVADDASEDGTAEAALAAGAEVVSRGRPHGKGANVTAGSVITEDVPPESLAVARARQKNKEGYVRRKREQEDE